MDSSDLRTLLPPRKRLLAGLKNDSFFYSGDLFPLPSGEIFARLREVLSSGLSSPEEILEASDSAASAAAVAAAAARAVAVEKAATAVKAKAAARDALELLASISSRNGSVVASWNQTKPRKRRARIELLYKKKIKKKKLTEPAATCQADEELARKLHRAMNSSTRVSTNSSGKVADMSGLGNGNDGQNRNSVSALEGKVALCSKADILEWEAEQDFVTGEDVERSEDRPLSRTSQGKVKLKKLLLSQCVAEDQGCSGKTPSELPESSERRGVVPTRISTIWKSKKFKTSQCFSEKGNTHPLSSNPPAGKQSSLVKVDS